MELASTGGFLKTPRAAEYAGVCADYLRQLASRGVGPRIAKPLGRGHERGNFYTRADLDAWMAAGRGARSGYEDGEKVDTDRC